MPTGVTANVQGQTISVKGPKGTLSLIASDRVTVAMDKGSITVDPKDESKEARAMWGTVRANLNNIVTGVTKGFERKLEITGVGYRAAVQGKNLQLQLGYSHDVVYAIPEGIAIVTPEADRNRDHRHRQARRSARWPPKSAPIVRRSPTRARA